MGLNSQFQLSLFKRIHPRLNSPNNIYLTFEKCIWSGTGVYDYLMMDQLSIDPTDNSLVLSVRTGPSHNGETDQRLWLFTSPDGDVWTGPTVALDPGYFAVGEVLVDPAISCLSNGRWVITFAKRYPMAEPAGRIQFYLFSDDKGATWSNVYRLTTDYDTPGQLLGVHNGYEQNGYFHFCVYAAVNVPLATKREGRIYRIALNADWTNPANWTRFNKTHNIEDFDGEEPSIFQLNDGTNMAFIRSDDDSTGYYVWSPDYWTHVSRISRTFPSNGKSGGCVTPSNIIATYGRKITSGDDLQRTFVSYTKDCAKTFINRDDSRIHSPYHGGNFVWHPGKQKLIGVFTIETLFSPFYQGPNTMIYQEFTESPTPLTEAPTYNEEYISMLDFPQGLGYTVPDFAGALRALENQLISDLKSDGIWGLLDNFYVFYHGNTNLGDYSRYNWKGGGWIRTLTPQNSPTFTAQGFDFNGSNQRIDTGFAPSGGVNYTQNNACAFIWAEEDVAEVNHIFGASNANFSTIQNAVCLCPRNASNQARYAINDSTLETVAGITDGSGLWMLQRRASNDKRLWRNGVQIDTKTTASTGRTAIPVMIGCTNFNTTPNLFNTRKVSFFGSGASLSGLEAQLHTRLSAFRTSVQAL